MGDCQSARSCIFLPRSSSRGCGPRRDYAHKDESKGNQESHCFTWWLPAGGCPLDHLSCSELVKFSIGKREMFPKCCRWLVLPAGFATVADRQIITQRDTRMRFAFAATTIMASFFILSDFAASAGTDAGLPQRAPGKWKLTTVMDQRESSITQSLTMCITEELEDRTANASAAEHASNCSLYEVKKVADKTIVEASCSYAVDMVKSRTEMSGDFKSSFAIEIVSTTVTRPPGVRAISRKRTIKKNGEFLGSDSGDIKAGEAVGDDGSRVIVQ